ATAQRLIICLGGLRRHDSGRNRPSLIVQPSAWSHGTDSMSAAAAIVTMLSSSVAVLTAAAAMLASAYKRGQHEGRVTEILSRLAAIAADHETRLRALESRAPGYES